MISYLLVKNANSSNQTFLKVTMIAGTLKCQEVVNISDATFYKSMADANKWLSELMKFQRTNKVAREYKVMSLKKPM